MTSNDFETVAGIYFAALDYPTALTHFTKRVELAENRSNYDIRVSRISIADCYAHLGRFNEAIKTCKDVLRETQEDILIAICYQAMGEYYCRAGKYKTGIKCLTQAQKLFPGKKETYDHALLNRWLAYAHAKARSLRAARRLFNESTAIIKKTGHRDEIWIENYKLQAEVGLLPQLICKRLPYFPGIPQNQFADWRKEDLRLDVEKARIVVNLSSNEYVFRGKHYLGIPLELKLLANLKIVEPWGLAFENAKVALWPTEAHSYLQLEERIHRLLGRLRKTYGIRFSVKRRKIYLDKGSSRIVGIIVSPRTGQVPTRLTQLQSFSRNDLEKLYQLKKTQSAKWIADMLAAGLIQSIGQGPRRRYCVFSSSPDDKFSAGHPASKSDLKNLGPRAQP